MPDPRDGQITGHSTEQEPQDRAFAREAPERAPAERDPAFADAAHFGQSAGETTDSTEDYAQETAEDGSAAEEEGVQTTIRLEASPAAPPLPTSQAPAANRREHEAGESPDAIQDSTQFGKDDLADRAEERSIRHEDSQHR